MFTCTWFWSMGAMSMTMMRSTSMTSTSGVTLMSALTPPLAPPTSIDMAIPSVGAGVLGVLGCWGAGSTEIRYLSTSAPRDLRTSCVSSLRRLLDEVVHELRRRVVHLDVEVLEPAREVVVEPHGRNRDDQAQRGFNQRFRNTGRDGGQARGSRGADPGERVDDADDRAEQADERGRRADGRERRDALLQVVGRQRRGALDGAAHGVQDVIAVERAARVVLELVFLQPGEHDLREMAVLELLRLRDRQRVLQPAFLEVLGNLRGVEFRLFPRLIERVIPLNRHAERNHRHTDEDEGHGSRHEPHLFPHVPKIELSTTHCCLRSATELLTDQTN